MFTFVLDEWYIRNIKQQKKYGEHLHCFCEIVTRAVNSFSNLCKCCKCEETVWQTANTMLVERRLQ